MSDVLLKHLIGGEANRVLESFRFQIFVDLWVGEGGIGPEVAPDILFL
jgi:hypothetical protein